MKLCCFSVINVKTMLQAFTFIFFQHRYWHTDATDFSMFSLAPMLPMFDVRCANRPNSSDYHKSNSEYRIWLKSRAFSWTGYDISL